MGSFKVSPTYDFTGASFNKTFELENSDLTLDGYWGKTNTKWRVYFRDGVPGMLPSGPKFQPIEVKPMGVALTYRKNDDIYLASFQKIAIKRTDGQRWPDAPVLVSLAPGISYYDLQPGIGVPGHDAFDMTVFIIGADIGLGDEIRLAGEYVKRRLQEVKSGLNSGGEYLSLRKRIGQPYDTKTLHREDR